MKFVDDDDDDIAILHSKLMINKDSKINNQCLHSFHSPTEIQL